MSTGRGSGAESTVRLRSGLPGSGLPRPAVLHRLTGLVRQSWRRPTVWSFPLYAVVIAPLAFAEVIITLFLLFWATLLTITPLGLWAVAAVLRMVRTYGRWHRGLARVLLREPIEEPTPRGEPGLLGWRRNQLQDGTAWRTLIFLIMQVPAALFAAVTSIYAVGAAVALISYPVTYRWNGSDGIDGGGHRHHGYWIGSYYLGGPFGKTLVCLGGLLLLLATPLLTRLVIAPERWLLRALLRPSPTARRIRDLETSRALAVDDAAAALRRIERDLHDGVQARLVALTMQLAMIRESLVVNRRNTQILDAVNLSAPLGPAASDSRVPPADPLELVDVARQQAKDALAELRNLARGIHPPALDLGLEAALATLAATCGIPVRLSVRVRNEPSLSIKTIAYFCAAELLTNVVRHSGARQAWLDVTDDGAGLLLRVGDDGRGGARIGDGSGLSGSGLAGLRGRAATVDGEVWVDSPPGGPTEVTVALPVPPGPAG